MAEDAFFFSAGPGGKSLRLDSPHSCPRIIGFSATLENQRFDLGSGNNFGGALRKIVYDVVWKRLYCEVTFSESVARPHRPP